MREVKVAVTQMVCTYDKVDNIKRAEGIVREASKAGANIILLQELFSTVYFCQEYNFDYFSWAETSDCSDFLNSMSELAKELNVVLPICFFERDNNIFFDTIMMIDADGTKLGLYRKTHIPDDPGYYEKFYFTPGNTGFKVWNTKFGYIGTGICWDQWYPEAARCMALQGAELILYPTAIGTYAVPHDQIAKASDSRQHWKNVMIGHAAANMIPVLASNRIGVEKFEKTSIRFFGNSVIIDEFGNIANEMDDKTEGFIIAEFDLDKLAELRVRKLNYRDRRPECYSRIVTLDGKL